MPKIGIESLVYDYLSMEREDKRDYMGASILGEECDRKLWYDFKLQSTFPARIKMIFEVGKLLESYVIGLLRNSGMTIIDRDDKGEQLGFIDGFIAGHVDGIISGLPESSKRHILEIKSANSKSFSGYVKNGVKQESQRYYYQMQVYMHYLKIEDALFVMINKDNCELYFERLKYDNIMAGFIINRGKEIALLSSEPERKYKTSSFYKCKFCNHAEECWK